MTSPSRKKWGTDLNSLPSYWSRSVSKSNEVSSVSSANWSMSRFLHAWNVAKSSIFIDPKTLVSQNIASDMISPSAYTDTGMSIFAEIKLANTLISSNVTLFFLFCSSLMHKIWWERSKYFGLNLGCNFKISLKTSSDRFEYAATLATILVLSSGGSFIVNFKSVVLYTTGI